MYIYTYVYIYVYIHMHAYTQVDGKCVCVFICIYAERLKDGLREQLGVCPVSGLLYLGADGRVGGQSEAICRSRGPEFRNTR